MSVDTMVVFVLGYALAMLVLAIVVLRAFVRNLAARSQGQALRRRLQEWIRVSGWTRVGADPSLAQRWEGGPFGIGWSRTVSDVLVGTWAGRPALSFTYAYTTAAGDDEALYTWHVLALPLPASLPRLELQPDSAAVRVARNAAGHRDIDFESDDFNRAWRVESASPVFAHDVIHPRLMQLLMRPDVLGSRLMITGTDIVSWAVGPTDPDRIAGRLALLSDVIDSVPRYVWQDHGYDPGGAPG